MFTKILLLTCAVFSFIDYSLAKLELVLATIQEPTTEPFDVEQAARIFASGSYLADKYRKQFQINSNTLLYTDKDVEVIATKSKNAKQAALLFKQGVLSQHYWRYKDYNQSVYEQFPSLREMELWKFKPSNDDELAKVAELDKKFLVYDSENCPAFSQEIINEEKHQCLSALIGNDQQIKNSKNNNPINEIFHSMLRNLDFDSKMKRLSGGPLLNEIMENIHQLSVSFKANTNDPKIFLYVLPSELMAFLILSFSVPGTRYNEQDLEDHINPELGSLFVLELYSNYTQNEDEWTIKLQYRNEDNDVLQPIRLPDCGIRCPVRIAYEKLKPYMPNDEDMKTDCQSI